MCHYIVVDHFLAKLAISESVQARIIGGFSHFFDYYLLKSPKLFLFGIGIIYNTEIGKFACMKIFMC